MTRQRLPNETPGPQAANPHTGVLLRSVWRGSFQRFREIFRAYDLHPMHFGMLTIIDAEEPISQQELSRRIGVDPSAMVARMDVLDERGLVDRARGVADRRSYEIRLTPAGRALLAELRRETEEYDERFFAPLTPGERQQLHDLLEKLATGRDEDCPSC